MSPRLRAWFEEYADYHRDPVNRLIHKIAIPVIVFHILAMLDWIDLVPLGRLPFTSEPYHLSVGHLFFAAVLAWYVRLSPRLAAIAFVLFAPMFPLGAATPRGVVVALAVVAWTAQLAGHAVWEKRSPAFVTNLLQALVGPLYFLALATGDWSDEGRAEAAAGTS